MSEQIGRQKQAKNRNRITRGFSDLPKQSSRESSSDESSEEEGRSDSLPKTKKIHHMTLKAMERKKVLEEQIEKEGIEPQELKPVERPPPRKRGRPKGSRKIVNKEDKEDYQISIEEESQNGNENKSSKKELNLRKRDRKKILESESEEQGEKGEVMKSIDIEIVVPLSKPTVVRKKTKGEGAVPPPPCPKKRGRKKKVQSEQAPQLPALDQPIAPAAKVFTVPKAQTYNNYDQFYKKIMVGTKQDDEPDIPLIFDRFSFPESYKRLIKDLSK